MAIPAFKTCKVWIILNPCICYSDCFWDTGRCSLLSLSFSFFDRIFLKMIMLFFFYYFLPFLWCYSRVPGNHWFPYFAPWVPELVLCPSPRRLSLSLFLIFSSFWFRFFESPWLTFLFRSVLVFYVTFLMVQLLAVLLLCHFSWVGGIQLCWFESFCGYFLFYCSLF